MASAPHAAIGVAGLALNMYGQRKQQRSIRDAQEERLALEREQRRREEMAASRGFAAQLAANERQMNLANSTSDALRKAIADNFGDLRSSVDANTQAGREKLDRVIDTQLKAGGSDPAEGASDARRVGDEVKGRVSESFVNRGRTAQATNEGKADTLAGRLATINAFRMIPADRQKAFGEVGIALGPHDRRRQSAAAEDRIRVARAGLMPDEPTSIVEYGSPLGDALSGLGQGLQFWGLNGGFGGSGTGPFTTSGGGGSGVGPVTTWTR